MNKGFSLTELVLVLGLVGLLAAMAYPNYTQVLIRTRRLEAQTTLLSLANRLVQEQHQNPKYLQALTQTTPLTRWYRVHADIKKESYLLTATPLGSQGTHDLLCQSLTLTNLGVEDITQGPKGHPQGSVEQCWV